MADVFRSEIFSFLATQKPLYHGKLLELRESIQRWLAYIPQTFPHYTRHTVEHSDELIIQASKFLFWEDDPRKPAVSLSAIEAYVIAAAAYLHDAGMVAPDREKLEVLQSNSWKEWVTGGGGGAKRWCEIQDFRGGSQPVAEAERHFIADYQTRFLIAEFVRKIHHLRAARVIAQHQTPLGRFAFDDPMLARTISNVCVGHGLRHHELLDADRYPERQTVRGETINVRFVVIALRLADLLDMSNDRACPLLLNAACPLPPDSLAHWTQYQRITHRLTAPDEISISAECHTQDEHRILQDWCQWIVDEVQHARIVMARAPRHSEWRPPRAGFEGPGATIAIKRAEGATYIPSRWTFELDRDAVFERLIHDVYDRPLSFVRELIQNALDAMRCRLYSDLAAEQASNLPESPTQVSEERRHAYVLKLVLDKRSFRNDLSAEAEERQVVVIDDCGIGMDREIIERYLLQVGRSYYQSEAFRQVYPFVPTSRFGVGFLSVFAVSDHVTVDTFKPTSKSGEGPIRLVLRGPRNYLLTTEGQRRESGTRIEVVLREPLVAGQLAGTVRELCRRVEFPIEVTEFEQKSTTVTAEKPDDFVYEVPDVTQDGARFLVRAYPIARSGIEGEMYVFARQDSQGESWAGLDWARYTYPTEHPQAVAPQFVQGIVCHQGLLTGAHFEEGPMVARVDYRGAGYTPVLGRHGRRFARERLGISDTAIVSRCEEILREHLASSPLASGEEGWRYKQKLVGQLRFESFWAEEPGMVPYRRGGKRVVGSLLDILATERVWVGLHASELSQGVFSWGAIEGPSPTLPLLDDAEVVVVGADLRDLSGEHRAMILGERGVGEVRWLDGEFLFIEWLRGQGGRTTVKWSHGIPCHTARLEHNEIVGYGIHKTVDSTYACAILNEDNALVQWFLRVRDACQRGVAGLRPDQLDALMRLLDTPLRYHGHEVRPFLRYLDQWRNISGLPPELHPPPVDLTARSFTPQAALRLWERRREALAQSAKQVLREDS